MMGHILNHIINTVNYEIRLAVDKLQVEESAREVASLQGHVAGYRELISNLCAQFHLTQSTIEDNNDEPLKIPDLDDEQLAIFKADADAIRGTDEWRALLSRVEDNINDLKNRLLYSAEKTRDLDICQGKYQGQVIYSSIFESIDTEVRRRENREQSDSMEPDLPFDDDVPATSGLHIVADDDGAQSGFDIFDADDPDEIQRESFQEQDNITSFKTGGF